MQILHKMTRLIAVILLLSLVGACGQKGDLYLPDNLVKKVAVRLG